MATRSRPAKSPFRDAVIVPTSPPIVRKGTPPWATPWSSNASNQRPTCVATIGAAQEMFARLESVYRRRQILEKHLRIHYPTLRTGETLFPEWDAHDFGAIEHRGYHPPDT